MPPSRPSPPASTSPPSTSRRHRGCTARPRPADGKAAFDAWLGRRLPGRDARRRPARWRPSARRSASTSASPTRTSAATGWTRCSPAAGAGMKAWRDAGPEGRTGVCLEVLDRLHGRIFELANAVQHTSGQAFVMAFQAGGAHALDRALEAIAYAWVEMTRTPATARWEKPGKAAAGDGEDVHGRAARHRAGDRVQHLPDLELVARAVRLAGHREPRGRQAPPRRGAAARAHGPGLPGGAGRGRASTRTW